MFTNIRDRRPQESQRRLVLFLAASAGAVVGLMASHRSAQAQADTVLVFPATTYTQTSSGGGSLWEDKVITTVVPGRRYLLKIANGAPTVTSGAITIGGQQWVGTSELTMYTTSLTRTIDLSGDDAMDILLSGRRGSNITIWIIHVPDSTFKIYGRKTFVRPNPPATQVDSFATPQGAGPGYTLRVINGTPAGGSRITTGTLSLNGSTILQSSDFGTGIATITRSVTLDSLNHLSIDNTST